jgi:glycosyltransferase involved in cell wall biosynthesis
MRKLLVISGRGFPPENETGITRVLKFVKYLGRFGFRSVVLAPRINVETTKDSALLDEVPSDAKVVRTANLSLMLQHHSMEKIAKSSFVFDADIGWFPTAYRKGLRIIKGEGIDAIYSSSPPATSHVIAHFLKQKTGLPWIADFRDPWTQFEDYWSLSDAHKKFEENVEKKVMGSADRIVFVTEPQLSDFGDKYPAMADRLILIPNGFDPEDFAGIKAVEDSRMVFSYVGTVYHHYPLSFLKAFKELAAEIPDFEKKVRVVFCGKIHPGKIKEIRGFRLNGMVDVRGLVTQREALEQLVNSDVLLLSFADKTEFTKIYTTRLFNYLAANRFIMATIPEVSLVANLIKEANSGVVFDPNDTNAIKDGILGLYNEYNSKGKVGVEQKKEAFSKFNRVDQSQKLAGILNEIVEVGK